MANRFKVVLIGDGGVGKSTFIRRHLTGDFNPNYVATLGVDVWPLEFNTTRGKIIFDICDTAGQDKFGGLKSGYWVESRGCIAMFDVSSRTSYNNMKKWIQDFQKTNVELSENHSQVPVVLCGNKVDLKNRQVQPQSIVLHKESDLGIVQYYDISAKSNYNYERPFLCLARTFLNDSTLEFTV